MAETYGLVLRFPDQSPSFVHGFEAGKLDARFEAASIGLQTIEPTEVFLIHVANEQIVTDDARRFGLAAIISPCVDKDGTDYSDTYTNVRFEKVV